VQAALSRSIGISAEICTKHLTSVQDSLTDRTPQVSAFRHRRRFVDAKDL
jgi:hypothetical protein